LHTQVRQPHSLPAWAGQHSPPSQAAHFDFGLLLLGTSSWGFTVTGLPGSGEGEQETGRHRDNKKNRSGQRHTHSHSETKDPKLGRNTPDMGGHMGGKTRLLEWRSSPHAFHRGMKKHSTPTVEQCKLSGTLARPDSQEQTLHCSKQTSGDSAPGGHRE
jgi:hypothetical protein